MDLRLSKILTVFAFKRARTFELVGNFILLNFVHIFCNCFNCNSRWFVDSFFHYSESNGILLSAQPKSIVWHVGRAGEKEAKLVLENSQEIQNIVDNFHSSSNRWNLHVNHPRCLLPISSRKLYMVQVITPMYIPNDEYLDRYGIHKIFR